MLATFVVVTVSISSVVAFAPPSLALGTKRLPAPRTRVPLALADWSTLLQDTASPTFEALASFSSLPASTLLTSALEAVPLIPSIPLQELQPLLEARQAELLEQLNVVEGLLSQTQPPAFPANFPLALRERDFAGPALGALALIASRTLDWRGSQPVPRTPYPSGRYDPDTARAYFAARPLDVLRCIVRSALPASGFGVALLTDWLRGPEIMQSNARVRAEQLVTALTEMGPTCKQLEA